MNAFDQNQSFSGQISVARALKKKWNSKRLEMWEETEKLVDTLLDILEGTGYLQMGCFVSSDHVPISSDGKLFLVLFLHFLLLLLVVK